MQPQFQNPENSHIYWKSTILGSTPKIGMKTVKVSTITDIKGFSWKVSSLLVIHAYCTELALITWVYNGLTPSWGDVFTRLIAWQMSRWIYYCSISIWPSDRPVVSTNCCIPFWQHWWDLTPSITILGLRFHYDSLHNAQINWWPELIAYLPGICVIFCARVCWVCTRICTVNCNVTPEISLAGLHKNCARHCSNLAGGLAGKCYFFRYILHASPAITGYPGAGTSIDLCITKKPVNFLLLLIGPTVW